MREGKCPKCSSVTVYTRKGGVGDTHIHVDTSFLSLPVEIISFVCTTCGYFENYISDRDKLADVAKKWERVPTTEK
jgi:hypothetical protein